MTFVLSQMRGFNARKRAATQPAFSDVVLLMPLDIAVANNTADISNSPLTFTLADFSLTGGFTTVLGADTLFGELTTDFMSGSGFVWGGNSYNENHFNFAAFSPSKLDLIGKNWCIEGHFKLESADGNDCGGWIINCGGLGRNLGNGWSGNYDLGMYGVGVDFSGVLRYSQGAANAGSSKQTLSSSAVTKDVYHHFAVSMADISGTPTIRVFIDGTKHTQATQTVAMSGAPSYFVVGGLWNQATPNTGYPFRGKLANLRITANNPVYIEDFYPPTAPHPTS